jgi:hypothetical protein
MSITYKEYINSQTNYNIQHLEDVGYLTLIDLFGDEFTYNQLNKYKDNESNDLIIASKNYDDNMCILTIWINNEYVDDIRFKDCGYPLVYKLSQLSME